MPEDEVGIMWEKRRGGSAGGAGRGTVGRRVGPPVSSSLKYCETCIVNPLLTDVLRFCLTRWSVLFRIALWDCFFGRYRFFYWLFRSCFVNFQNSSSSAVPQCNWTKRALSIYPEIPEIPFGMLMEHTFSRRSTGKLPGISGILKR